MRIFSRLPLATRLSLFAVLTLCPLAVLLVFSHFHDRSQRREAGITEANNYGRNLGNQLEGTARDLDGFMGAAALLLGSDDGPITQENSSLALKNLQSRYDNITTLFVTDLDGKVTAQSAGKDTGFDVGSRPYIKALQAGQETYWSGGLEGLRTGTLTVAYARVIYNEDKSRKAFLVAAFKPSEVGSLPPGLPSDANIVLIDSTGQVIYNGRDPKGEHTQRDASKDPAVQAALEGKPQNIKNQSTPFDTGGDRYGVIVPIPHLKWLVAYTRSQNALDASLTDRLRRDLLVMGGVMLLTIAVLGFVARRIVKPIGVLAAAAEGIAEGKRVQLPVANEDPDVAKLEQAFASMSTAVAEREDRLREQALVMAALDDVGSRLASDLDFETTVQTITDAGTRLTEAQFGAFFYNVTNAEGESYQLYALAGVDPSNFENFPMPRNTEIFAPTFSGEGVVRIDDVTQDPRFGKNPPFNGMPKGHLPVRSYLAAPVFSRSGDVMGGLFFGHPNVGVFKERHESLVTGIASWAAIALNNAQTYRESQQAQEVLRKANAAKDEFLGVVSHELRTPTTTIYGGVRMLDSRRHLLSQDATAELIHTMSEEAERLVRLIENLLVFARLELGRMPDLEPCDMEGLAKECLEAFKRSHAQRPVLVEIDPDMAPVPAQPTSLERVIENLLSNADKYSPAGEPLTLKVTQAAGEMLVSVSDHGKGVPEDELDLIFDSFYRSQGASSVATGHGLGLSISKRIVEAHAGRIWAKNLPGGFEVGFSLPLDDSNIDGESAAEPAVNGTENGHSNGHVAPAVENDAGREDLTHAG